MGKTITPDSEVVASTHVHHFHISSATHTHCCTLAHRGILCETSADL